MSLGAARKSAQCHYLRADGLAKTICNLICFRDGLPHPFCRHRIYTLAVVVRLMLVQRLLEGGSLSQAVQRFVQGQGDPGPGPRAISLRTGAYCRARQKLPTLVANQVLDAIVERLQGWLPSNPILADRPVFVVDGSTLPLPPTAELKKAHPPCHNQHGQSHWPILRMVVLQDAQTGLALRPHWGPLNGPLAVSEQQLKLQATDQLPPQAVMLGDRKFGVFGVAWAAKQHNHPVLLRLTRESAQRIGSLTGPQDRAVVWRPTRWDLCGGPLDSPAALPGRLLCVTPPESQQPEPFYFFTTLDLPAEQIFQLYGLKRDKANLDIFWLRDESLGDSSDLPDPAILAAEIVEDLQAALDQFAQIASDLMAGERSTGGS